MMDHAYIAEHQIVDRYLLGQLTAGESERFERHYLGCQSCLDELALAEDLAGGMKRVAAADAARRAAVGLGIFAWLARRGRAAQAGVLAALALAVLLPAGLLLRGGGAEPTPEPVVDVPIVFLSPERGGAGSEPSHRLTPPVPPRPVVLALEIDPPHYPAYDVELARAGGGSLWRGEGLTLQHLDLLTLGIPAELLAAGDYELVVTGREAGGGTVPVARFALRVLPALR